MFEDINNGELIVKLNKIYSFIKKSNSSNINVINSLSKNGDITDNAYQVFSDIFHKLYLIDILDYIDKSFLELNKSNSYLYRLFEEDKYAKNMIGITRSWLNKVEPIEKQSEYCIDLVYKILIDINKKNKKA